MLEKAYGVGDVEGGGYVASVGARLRTNAAQQPGRALGVLAAVALLGSALAAGWTDRLTLSSANDRGPGLEIHVRGALPAGSPTYRIAVQVMRSQLGADPNVGGVRVRHRGATTVLLVDFKVGGRQRDAAISHIEHGLDPGPLTLSFSGSTAAVRQAKDDALDSLWPLLAALAVAALLASGTLGARPAGAALLAAAASSALAALICELVGGRVDVSWLALVGAACGGTLLSFQLCAMAAGGSTAPGLWGAGMAAAATFAATAALGVGYLTSLGLGGALGSLLAVPASITAMGAMGGDDGLRVTGAAQAPWRGIGGVVGWSLAFAIAIALLALLLLAIVVVPVGRLATEAIGSAAPLIDTGQLAAAAAAAAIATLAIAAIVGRRPGLATGAALVAAIPGVAAAGLLVHSFQEARLESLLDYTSSGSLQLGSVTAAVVVVAALCAAQAVALAAAARTREPGVEGVAATVGRCGAAAALACLSGVAAGAALGVGSPTFMKEFGLGVAAGLLLELLVVQMLIAPALLRVASVAPRDQ
jgi:hypothetical protein